MSLQTIQRDLRDSYDYFVVPVAMTDTPIELAELQKYDDTDTPINGEYYTLNELSTILGKQFTLLPIIDERFIAFRWAVDWDGTEAVISKYLKANGLVDMRDGVDGRLKVHEIDFTALNGNEFGMFNKLKFMQVPKIKEDSI